LSYVSNLRKFVDSAPFFFFKFPNSSLLAVTSPIESAEQQHRFIFQSNKAVARNFPEKVKIYKIIKNSQRMVRQRSPASCRKRFRFSVMRGVASNSRRLIFGESETARCMSPFGSESRRSRRPYLKMLS
jgi:hypothetical protein